MKILKLSSELQQRRKMAVIQFKRRRDYRKVKASLDSLSQAAKGSENLMPYIIESIESDCTLGEISDTLRGVFGTYDARS